MRIALVSDIHANIQAWKAVLLDIRSMGADRIICLGDIVGYGPAPAETLQSVHAHVNHFVLGNHDAVICGKMDTTLFNDRARELIEWTRAQLTGKAADFLSDLPLTIKGQGFRCTHGDFQNPAAFNYIIEPQDAMPSWNAVAENLLFVGHSHVPGIFILGASGIPRQVPPQDFVIEPGKRFLINAGSVGNPRDGDPRASYLILDLAQQAVFWRRIPFDLDAFRQAMQQAGLPSDSCHFLQDDPLRNLPPLRTMLNFSPAETKNQQPKNTVDVEDISLLKQKAARWKKLFWILLAALLVSVALVSAVWWRSTPRPVTLGTLPPELPTGYQAGENSAISLPADSTHSGNPVPGWLVKIGDRRTQHCTTEMTQNGETALRLNSASPSALITLSAPFVRVGNKNRLYTQLMIRPEGDFDGRIELILSLKKKNEADRIEFVDNFFVKEPNERRAEGWLLARQTLQRLPAGSYSVQFHIKAAFAGSVLIKDPQLILLE